MTYKSTKLYNIFLDDVSFCKEITSVDNLMEDVQMTLVKLTELEFVRETILKSNKNIQEWAYDLNVSRQTIYDWLNKDVKIRKKNVYQVAELANKEVTIHNGVVKLDNQTIPENKERTDMSLDAQKIINNQNTQIDLMQEKIDNLEEQAKNRKNI